MVTIVRWEAAQKAEAAYWDRVRRDPAEIFRIIYEKYVFLNQVKSTCPQALVPPHASHAEALEIGIGALGIGVASLLEPEERWLVTGVDPMPRVKPIEIPHYLMEFSQKLMGRLFRYVQAAAEKLDFSSRCYDLVSCYNVLDHTQNPYVILDEINRVLRPGGYFLLGLDALSLANWLRHRVLIEDVVHPYKFTAWHVERMLPQHGFELLYFERARHELPVRVFGKARRLIAVGRKPIGLKSKAD